MSEFDYDKFTKDERERYLASERYRQNDFFEPNSPQQPKRGVIASISYSIGLTPLWLIFLCWLFWGGIPGRSPSSLEFSIQWLFWFKYLFLLLSTIVMCIFFYSFNRGKEKALQKAVKRFAIVFVASVFWGAVISLFKIYG